MNEQEKIERLFRHRYEVTVTTRLLEWYENREIVEMPEYVRHKNTECKLFFKVKTWKKLGKVPKFVLEDPCWLGLLDIHKILPATKAEYEENIQYVHK